MEDILQVEGLNVSYNDKEIVQNVSFSIGRGQIAAIVGESGSGKTTILRAIGGLLPKNGRITSGKVSLDGMELNCMSEEQWRRYHGEKIGMIFQNPELSLSPLIKLDKQFAECVAAHGQKSKRETHERAAELLKKMRFHNPEMILKSYPFELSGGMCQRVAIALAVINQPSLLIADEPTSALDVAAQNTTIDTLRDLNKETEMSILMVTHNIGVAYKMADYLGVMYQGKMIEWGMTMDILRNPKAEYTRKLIDAIPKL